MNKSVVNEFPMARHGLILYEAGTMTHVNLLEAHINFFPYAFREVCANMLDIGGCRISDAKTMQKPQNQWSVVERNTTTLEASKTEIL